MYRNNTPPKTCYLQIFQLQLGFSCNQFHSVLFNWLCVTSVRIVHWSTIVSSQQDLVPFHAFLLIMFYFSIYCVLIKKSFVTEMGQTRPRKTTEERPHMTWQSKEGTTVQWKGSPQPWAAHSWRRWSNPRLQYQHLNRYLHIAEKRLFGNVWCWGWCILCLRILTLHFDCSFNMYNTDGWKLWLISEIEGYRMYRWSRNDIDIFTDL